MDWDSFLLGYAVGTGQMVAIDAVILSIVWPLREFIKVLKDPLAKARVRIYLGIGNAADLATVKKLTARENAE